jgi:hypothetical protein
MTALATIVVTSEGQFAALEEGMLELARAVGPAGYPLREATFGDNMITIQLSGHIHLESCLSEGRWYVKDRQETVLGDGKTPLEAAFTAGLCS